MKVLVNGKLCTESVNGLIEEVLNNMTGRLGLPEGTTMKIEGLEFKVVFNINGLETYATIPRNLGSETINEIFMVAIHLDEEGNIVQSEDNEKESFYDGFTLAKSAGLEYEYTGIESKYENEDLELLESLGENTETDAMSVRYRLKRSPEVEVLRHYKGDLLVSEYEYHPKETE